MRQAFDHDMRGRIHHRGGLSGRAKMVRPGDGGPGSKNRPVYRKHTPPLMDGRRPYCVEVVVDGPALSTPDVIEAVSRAVRAARMRGCTRAIVTYEFAGVDGPENYDMHLPVDVRDDTAIHSLRRNMETRLETMRNREMRGVRRIRLFA